MTEVTRILDAIDRGETQAAGALLPLVYQELRKLAAQLMSQEKPGQTLDATGLVHEAYLRLVVERGEAKQDEKRWDGRRHFFAAAAEAMRRILVENARKKHSLKRGGDRARLEFTAAEVAKTETADELIALDEALERLAAKDLVKAELVKLRYFAGLTTEQAAEILNISPATAFRYWAFARAWLHRAITSDEPGA